MSFAEDFRERVWPRIRGEAKTQALFVVLGLAEFEDARAAVMKVARLGGMGLLPQDRYEQLEEAIPSLIWAEFTAAEVRIAGYHHTAEADPVAHYENLAGASEPLRWAFAAVCPEYRAYLLAARRAR